MPPEILDPVLGDPVDVSAAGRTLASIALDVASIAAQLRSLASSSDWTGAAARSAHARSATVPPKLDKARVSYAAAGSALSAYARSLADAQQQSATAISSASRASADLLAAQAAQAAAAAADAAAAAAASTAGVPAPAPTAPRYQASIEDAAARLSRARALNEQAHDLQRDAARAAASALQQASHEGIRNASWMHRVAHSVGHWASTHWVAALHQVAKVANVVSALAGLAALVLAVAGVLFPPLEIAAAALETVSLVSAAVAGMADTALAVTGNGSWKSVGIDVVGLAPAGLGKVVTKVAPLLRESRLIKPSAVVHASSGEAMTAAAARSVHNASRGAAADQAGVWANPARLLTHFDDHGSDFGATSAEDYAGRASQFFSTSPQLRLPTKLAPDGTIRVFDPSSNTFGAYDIYGATKTFFKPKSPTYWDRQPGIVIDHGSTR